MSGAGTGRRDGGGGDRLTEGRGSGDREPAVGRTRAVRVRVRGRVQGVGFRWSALERARSLGVAGWVRNLPDGSVEAHVEGGHAQVEAMLAWLARGPRHASVEQLVTTPTAPLALDDFEIRR